MRVLHLVKTSEGAAWAAQQCSILTGSGIEVHVALPSLEGSMISEWRKSGTKLHVADLDFPAREPWRLPGRLSELRRLISEIKPDIVHSHFVGTTLVLRLALGKNHPLPRVYQVAGPLHLEHAFFRKAELSLAGSRDYWVGSSRYINRLYRDFGVKSDRLFLSYYGNTNSLTFKPRTGFLRHKLGIPDSALVVGNINFMYPPKRYLGQFVGLKCHEDVIDAISSVIQHRSDVYGVLIGGQWKGGTAYERRLRERAVSKAGTRIILPGKLSSDEVAQAWADFDLAVHVPMSENCGGVIEPLLASVPVIASQVGGLPEVVLEGVTGRTVPPRSPEALARTIENSLSNLETENKLAQQGKALVSEMFDVRRTAKEIHEIYRHILDPSFPRPDEYDSRRTLNDGK